MKEILILIGISALVSIIQSQGWYDKLLDKLKINMKPFNCSICMGFWVSFIFLFNFYGLWAFLIAGISGVLSEFFYRFLNNF